MARFLKFTKFVLLIMILCLGFASCTHIPEESKDMIYTEAAQTVVAGLTQTATYFPMNTATVLPTETATAEPTATRPPIVIPSLQSGTGQSTATSSAVYPYAVEFISSSPYPNQFLPGQKFTLTWQFKNTGTTNLSWKTRFYHQNGIQLADQSSYSIDQSVEPGDTLTISMPATAPAEHGTHKTEWVFQDPNGIIFFTVYYLAIVGDQSFITDEPGSPTSTPNSLYWMCSDPNRSNIQGNGCTEYCRLNGGSMLQSGVSCYSMGVQVTEFY